MHITEVKFLILIREQQGQCVCPLDFMLISKFSNRHHQKLNVLWYVTLHVIFLFF